MVHPQVNSNTIIGRIWNTPWWLLSIKSHLPRANHHSVKSWQLLLAAPDTCLAPYMWIDICSLFSIIWAQQARFTPLVSADLLLKCEFCLQFLRFLYFPLQLDRAVLSWLKITAWMHFQDGRIELTCLEMDFKCSNCPFPYIENKSR